MKYFLLLIGTITTLQLQAETLNLSGQLINGTDKPVAAARIHIIGNDVSTLTDEDGRFEFSNLETGSYEIDIEVSAEDHFITNVMHDGTPLTVDISLVSLDKLVVSSNPLEHNTLQMTTPVTIISEDELLLDRGLNINETLERIPGVNSGSFGVAAGQPVIRGQQGNRVTILNNNALVQDAANVSPDHAITAEPLLAKRVEVLKGPATLLYGGQAVGGVVNVIDNTIPTSLTDGIDGGIELRQSDAALDARSAVATLDFPVTERVVAHVDYLKTETNSYEIPGNAESDRMLISEGEEIESDGPGILENSDLSAEAYSVGFSFIGDNGYWGISYQDTDRNYGIPGHEEHHEEGEEDAAGDEEEEGEEEEIVRIDMEKSTFNLRGEHRFDASFFEQINFSYSLADYQHVELEGDEIGTLFDNEADETRIELLHDGVLGFNGAIGFQLTNRDFSALGDEAYIIPSDTRTFGVFMIEEKDFDNWHLEFGLRYDKQEIDIQNDPSFNDSTVRNIDSEAFSASIGANIQLNDRWSMPINYSSAQRLPTAEELFSNQFVSGELIPHLATASVEIGNINLEEENANNFDIGLRYRNEAWQFNLALFYNQVDDYIFLNPTGEVIEDFPVFIYDQQDATFKGYEAELMYSFDDSFGNQWNTRLFADQTEAELDQGGNVPRIPARRLGLGVGFNRSNFQSNLSFTRVDDQNDVTAFELPTDGYNALSMDISYVWLQARTETTLFLRGNNLLDEEIRDHASFIKDIAPRPGRSLTAGVRLTF